MIDDLDPSAADPDRYSYHPLEGFYRSNSGQETGHVFNGIDFASLPAPLRTILISDGTVTKLLEATYFEPIEVKRLAHGDFILEQDSPALEQSQGGHVLRRKVICRGVVSGRVFCHALSYIRPDQLWPGAHDDLIKGRLGIGELLRDRRVETFRELLTCCSEPAGELAGDLEVPPGEILISRTYRIHVDRKPAVWIADKFPISRFREKGE